MQYVCRRMQGAFSCITVGFLFLLTCLACSPEVNSPEDLAKLYALALREKKFTRIRPYWVGIRELNKLVELFPGISKGIIDKGNVGSEANWIDAQKLNFQKMLRLADDASILMEETEEGKFSFRELFKDKTQGISVGLESFELYFADQRMKFSILMMRSGNRWRYVDIYYLKILPRKTKAQEGPILGI